MNLFVSIIIICEKWNHFLEESIPYYKDLNYDNYEVLVFSTEPIQKSYSNVTFIAEPSTKNKPAEKRDLAIKHAKGGIYAFIDDDAFPHKDWIRNAVKHFEDKDITGVGGPGITPESTSVFEKASGWTTASPLGGFGSAYRFIPQKKRYVDDFPSMNLIVRAEDFKKIGGFDSNFYPGEDTKLCLDLTLKLNKKIIYDPKVVVYHHKRPLFKKHLIQNGRFGLHRGNFARTLPETSRRWFYFIPSVFFLGNVIGSLILFYDSARSTPVTEILSEFYINALGFYMLLLILNALWVLSYTKNLFISLLTIPGVYVTHMWYGLRFIQGFLFTKNLNDVYGRAGG